MGYSLWGCKKFDTTEQLTLTNLASHLKCLEQRGAAQESFCFPPSPLSLYTRVAGPLYYT